MANAMIRPTSGGLGSHVHDVWMRIAPGFNGIEAGFQDTIRDVTVEIGAADCCIKLTGNEASLHGARLDTNGSIPGVLVTGDDCSVSNVEVDASTSISVRVTSTAQRTRLGMIEATIEDLNAAPSAKVHPWSSAENPNNNDLLQWDEARGLYRPKPPGAAASLGYTHVQAVAAALWTINHPLTFQPNVAVVDSAGEQVEGTVDYVDADTVTVAFSAAFSGNAYLS